MLEELAEIKNLADHQIPSYAYGDNEAATDMSRRLWEILQIAANLVEAQVIPQGKFLPCPFCGAECKIEQRIFGDSNIYYYRIECNGVNNHSLDCWDDTEEEAKETWNKQARM